MSSVKINLAIGLAFIPGVNILASPILLRQGRKKLVKVIEIKEELKFEKILEEKRNRVSYRINKRIQRYIY